MNPLRQSGEGRRLPCRAGLFALLLGLGACANPLTNSAPGTDYFVIEDLRTAGNAAPGAARIDKVLMISGGPVQALFDSDRLVFSRTDASRAYYMYANWSERPGRRLLTLAESRLSASGNFKAVVQTTAGVRGDLLLNLRLDDLTHDDSKQPGQMRLVVVAELIDWKTHQFLQRRRFEQIAPVSSRDAAGAARAAQVAMTAFLDDLQGWVRQTAGPQP